MNITAIRAQGDTVVRAIIISITCCGIILATPAKIIRPVSPSMTAPGIAVPQPAEATCETSGPTTPDAAASNVVGGVLSGNIHNPRPPYPAMSKILREEGTVMLRVHVLSDGKADQVDIQQSSGSARLDEAARATIFKWRFTPARRGSEAVPSWVLVPISFKLISTEKSKKRFKRIDSRKNGLDPGKNQRQ
ncbi:MAG: energy transducer TonB [Azoarcus sp.]|nr:energy transducer TonB [Azoarcus sp.]